MVMDVMEDGEYSIISVQVRGGGIRGQDSCVGMLPGGRDRGQSQHPMQLH